MKRNIYRVQYISGQWHLGGPRIARDMRWYAVKAYAVGAGAALARSRWRALGQLGQLVVHGKDGRIQHERTYGRDPERHPG